MASILGRLDNLQGGENGVTLLDSLEASDITDATQPYLPSSDFKKVSGTGLSNGLVIQDTSNAGNGNQYVWIEVPNGGTGTKPDYTSVEDASDTAHIAQALIAYASDYRVSGWSDTYYEGCGISSQSAYEGLYAEMLSSVYTNGGFWIGRYEIGISQEESPRTASGNTTQTAVIQKDAYPYNYVTCSQAQNLASNINSGNCTSSLMFGIQWDLVMRYLEAKGTNQQYLMYTEDNNNNPGPGSTSFGNYGDAEFAITSTGAKYNALDEDWQLTTWKVPTVDTENFVEGGTKLANNDDRYSSNGAVLLTTGANEARNSKQNICDLAGNVEEWTLEYTGHSNFPCADRGGSYSYYGWNVPASYRSGNGTSFSDVVFGFRVSLY